MSGSKRIAEAVAGAELSHAMILADLNERYCVVPISGKTCIIAFDKFDGRETPTFFKASDFRELLRNKKIMIEVKNKEGEKVKKQISQGEWWLNHPDRRQHAGICFKPELPAVVDNRFNLWRGWGLQARAGDWTLLKQHIRVVLAAGVDASFDYIHNWTAWTLQNPGKMAEVALVFKGGRGTGKGIFGRALKAAFGQHGLQISSADHLTGKFNQHFVNTAFVFADEAYWPGIKAAEGGLKRLITEPTLFIEPKGLNGFEVGNALHVVMATNSEWVVPAGADERRFAVFEVSEDRKQDRSYFEPLYAEIKAGAIEAMMHDLQALDLKGWHPRYDVPQTAALHDQKMLSLSPEEQWWLSLLQSGELPEFSSSDEAAKNPRWARAESLFKHARETVPALKFRSDHALSEILKGRGCNRNSNHRIAGKRAWEFPPLAEARAAWSKVIPTKWEEKPEWTHVALARDDNECKIIVRVSGETDHSLKLEAGGEGQSDWFPKSAISMTELDADRVEVGVPSWLVREKKDKDIDLRAWVPYDPGAAENAPF